MNHLIEILTGADTEKIRRWGHDQLSTYGIGKELSRSEWGAIGRELLRAGLLEQEAGQFPVIALTADGLETLKSRRVISLTKPMASKKSTRPRAGEIECDETLFDRLRKLRKRLADERGRPIAPYPMNAGDTRRVKLLLPSVNAGQVYARLQDLGAVDAVQITSALPTRAAPPCRSSST